MRLLPELVALLGRYLDSDMTRYAAARRRRQTYQARFDDLAAAYDAVLLPAATGAAPPVESTGDAVMNRIWTALHVPAITVPFWCPPDGMPLGLQLVARSAPIVRWSKRRNGSTNGRPPGDEFPPVRGTGPDCPARQLPRRGTPPAHFATGHLGAHPRDGAAAWRDVVRPLGTQGAATPKGHEMLRYAAQVMAIAAEFSSASARARR